MSCLITGQVLNKYCDRNINAQSTEKCTQPVFRSLNVSSGHPYVMKSQLGMSVF